MIPIIVTNISGILFQLFGGFTAAASLQYCFLVHSLGIIIFILILFLPEPPKIPIQSNNKEKSKLSASIFEFVTIAYVLIKAKKQIFQNPSRNSVIKNSTYYKVCTADCRQKAIRMQILMAFCYLFSLIEENQKNRNEKGPINPNRCFIFFKFRQVNINPTCICIQSSSIISFVKSPCKSSVSSVIFN
jgi:hypothetical protein